MFTVGFFDMTTCFQDDVISHREMSAHAASARRPLHSPAVPPEIMLDQLLIHGALAGMLMRLEVYEAEAKCYEAECYEAEARVD